VLDAREEFSKVGSESRANWRTTDLIRVFPFFSFHRRGNEPERGSSVVPLLSDDVQLTVAEYRNKLYAMMDDKHCKHKNM